MCSVQQEGLTEMSLEQRLKDEDTANLPDSLLPPSRKGGRLEVEPPEPEVAVAVGESRQFACRLACADGQVASVQWRGLDTSLGSVKSGTGSSVLWVHNASLSAAGTRMCVGYCGKRSFHHTVNLLVFAFPDQLTVSPESLVPGRDREVACTAHNVSPARPDVFSMSLLLGDQELEGVQTLDRDVMEEPQEDEDPLFQVTERWLLPPLGIPAPPTLHCQVTMSLPGLNRSHRQSIPGSLPASAALWTGSLVLGLLLLVFLIYRLWKRCRPTS